MIKMSSNFGLYRIFNAGVCYAGKVFGGRARRECGRRRRGRSSDASGWSAYTVSVTAPVIDCSVSSQRCCCCFANPHTCFTQRDRSRTTPPWKDLMLLPQGTNFAASFVFAHFPPSLVVLARKRSLGR